LVVKASTEAFVMPVSEDCHNVEAVNYRQRYRNLKRKFKYLIYENECFQDELKKTQRKFLKVNQDKSFLLDRLLQYERLEDSSSDSDVTISSDSELDSLTIKKKKPTSASNSHGLSGLAHSSTGRHLAAVEPTASKRKKPLPKSTKASTAKSVESLEALPPSQGDGHMTSEEIERHLESRQLLLDLLPERAPPTVPTEMFSNDPMGMERYLTDEGI